MTNLDSILKSRNITLPTKVCLVKAMVFPVVMYGCESWGIKKAEHWRIDTFELWCWRRLLRVPWTARRSNQSILKEISPDAEAEAPILGCLMQRGDSLEKTLIVRGRSTLRDPICFLPLCAVSQGLSVPYQFLENRNEQSCTQFSVPRSWQRAPVWVPFSDSLQWLSSVTLYLKRLSVLLQLVKFHSF